MQVGSERAEAYLNSLGISATVRIMLTPCMQPVSSVYVAAYTLACRLTHL